MIAVTLLWLLVPALGIPSILLENLPKNCTNISGGVECTNVTGAPDLSRIPYGIEILHLSGSRNKRVVDLWRILTNLLAAYRLKELRLSYFRFPTYTLGSAVFQRCESLKVLNISFTDLKKIQRENFYGLNRLTHLYLNFNAISQVLPGAFCNLPGLTVLTVSHNLLTVVPEIQGDCAVDIALQRLDLSGNRLTESSIPVTIFDLPLEDLDLSSNRLRFVSENLILGFQALNLTLRSLSLHRNPWNCSAPALRPLVLWLQSSSGGRLICNSSGATACPSCTSPKILEKVPLNLLDWNDTGGCFMRNTSIQPNDFLEGPRKAELQRGEREESQRSALRNYTEADVFLGSPREIPEEESSPQENLAGEKHQEENPTPVIRQQLFAAIVLEESSPQENLAREKHHDEKSTSIIRHLPLSAAIVLVENDPAFTNDTQTYTPPSSSSGKYPTPVSQPFEMEPLSVTQSRFLFILLFSLFGGVSLAGAVSCFCWHRVRQRFVQ